MSPRKFPALCSPRFDRFRALLRTFALAVVLFIPQLATTVQAQPEPDELDTRVVGGSPARPNAYPSLVQVRRVSDDGKRGFFCGGTVIDPRWILTAAHCVSLQDGQVAKASAFIVTEGTSSSQSGGRRVAVDLVVRHPGYSPQNLSNDIALLELAQPSSQPRQTLVSRALRARLTHPGESATVAGWGDTAPQRSAPMRAAAERGLATELLQVTVPIVSLDRCRQAYPPRPDGESIHDHNVCAGLEEGGKDSCHGDSGGPLFVTDPTIGIVQVGVVSWGNGCGQAGFYGVYTSVGDFESFIRQHVPNAPLATASDGSASPGGALSPAQPSHMPAPGETGQVSVEVYPTGPVHLGVPVTVRVSSTDAGILLLFVTDSAGHVTQLFPNRYSSTKDSILVAGRQIRAGATIVIPGPADRFRLTATAPTGESTVIAIVAPPDAKLADLTERYQGLEEIRNADAFFAQLKDRLLAARLGDASSPGRNLSVEESKPAFFSAERGFTVTE